MTVSSGPYYWRWAPGEPSLFRKKLTNILQGYSRQVCIDMYDCCRLPGTHPTILGFTAFFELQCVGKVWKERDPFCTYAIDVE